MMIISFSTHYVFNSKQKESKVLKIKMIDSMKKKKSILNQALMLLKE